MDFRSGPENTQRHLAPGGEFECVREKVAYDLLESLTVRAHIFRKIIADFRNQTYSFLGRHLSEQLLDVRFERVQIYFFQMKPGGL